MFCDSAKGAESSAIVYSLVETAKANGIKTYAYLMLVLSMLPYLGESPAHEELEKRMPWHPAMRHREYIRKRMNGMILQWGSAVFQFGCTIIERLLYLSYSVFLLAYKSPHLLDSLSQLSNRWGEVQNHGTLYIRGQYR